MLHYDRHGSGPPLLMIQGLGGHSAHWGTDFPRLLAERLEVVTLDNIGTGRSGRLDVDGELSIAGMGADAAGVIEELGLERIAVLGLSMGGMIAQELVLARPQLVTHLLLFSTSPSALRGERTPKETMESLAAAWAAGDADLAVRAMWDVNVSAAYAADAENFDRWKTLATLRPVALEVIGAQLGAIRDHDALDRLGEVTAPTLVVHGTEDHMLPFRNGEMLAEAIPGARLERFDDTGHLVFLEHPQECAQLVFDFVGV